jgi:hypothetical protein
VLSVFPLVAKSNYPCGVFKLLANVLSVLLSVTDSNYPCGIFKLLVNVEDTTGVIRIYNPRENRQYIYQKFVGTTGVI